MQSSEFGRVKYVQLRLRPLLHVKRRICCQKVRPLSLVVSQPTFNVFSVSGIALPISKVPNLSLDSREPTQVGNIPKARTVAGTDGAINGSSSESACEDPLGRTGPWFIKHTPGPLQRDCLCEITFPIVQQRSRDTARPWVCGFSHAHSDKTTLVPCYLTELATAVELWLWNENFASPHCVRHHESVVNWRHSCRI